MTGRALADAAQARLFKRDLDSDPLIAVVTWRHPPSHGKPSETGTDRPGHGSADRHVGGTSARLGRHGVRRL